MVRCGIDQWIPSPSRWHSWHPWLRRWERQERDHQDGSWLVPEGDLTCIGLYGVIPMPLILGLMPRRPADVNPLWAPRASVAAATPISCMSSRSNAGPNAHSDGNAVPKS